MTASSQQNTIVLGAGFTGLGYAYSAKSLLIEAAAKPGGICASYSRDGFSFEIGGGHWIFGGSPEVLTIFESLVPCKRYNRKSAVYFAGSLSSTRPYAGTFAPFPLQNNLYALGDSSASRIFEEICAPRPQVAEIRTMDRWLGDNFGQELYELFFKPFHERYTDGLYTQIVPQDAYKSPFDLSLVRSGLNVESAAKANHAGYNTTFLYPETGLQVLAEKLAERAQLLREATVARINPAEKTVVLNDGREFGYNNLVSTAPLNRTLDLCGLKSNSDPFTSVLVLNIGAKLPQTAKAQHGYQWLYIPDSKSGFHRVGYYSNVDTRFLPEKYRDTNSFCSLYVEFAYANGKKPTSDQIDQKIEATLSELQSWGLIAEALVVDPTWIDVGYTWQRPNSSFAKDSIAKLSEIGITSSGRYGRWHFQGIAESFAEGLELGRRISL